MLSDKIKNEIKELIEKIESKSSAEIAVVVTNSCGSYRYSIVLVSLLFALVLPFAIKIFGYDLTSWQSVEIAILAFMFATFILEKSLLKYMIVPKKVKSDRCDKKAFAQFYRLGVDKTSNHKAILIFLSTQERYIRVVCDTKIDEVVDKNVWVDAVSGFIKYAKDGDIGKGLKYVVKECGNVLMENFPRDENSKDELSNKVVEI